jgi:hypothetical protein
LLNRIVRTDEPGHPTLGQVEVDLVDGPEITEASWSDGRFGSKPGAYRSIWICDRSGSTRSGIDSEGVRGQVQAERRMKARSSTSSPMERP